jgi:lysozyme family protein
MMTMSNFDQAFSDLLGNEGRFSDNPNDPGGPTCWGITISTARGAGYRGDMRSLDQDIAKEIYQRLYWKSQFDDLPYPVAFQVFDAAVNSGQTMAIRWLQRAVGTIDDGIIGPATMAATKAYDPIKLVMRYNAARLEFLTNLPGWDNFGKGWARRIANNLRKVAN